MNHKILFVARGICGPFFERICRNREENFVISNPELVEFWVVDLGVVLGVVEGYVSAESIVHLPAPGIHDVRSDWLMNYHSVCCWVVGHIILLRL